jgi:hypothetical protein
MPMKLKRSSDRKVAIAQGTILNAFGLPSGARFSCPGQTSVCEAICYAGQIEKQYVGVRNLLSHNWQIVTNSTQDETVSLLEGMLSEFLADCTKRNVAPKFRIHWDGDFFSADYTIAWARAIRSFPQITFWAYTRSFQFVQHLSGLDNLTLYLSADKANVKNASETLRAFPWVKWSFLADTMTEGKEINKGIIGKPGASCPEITKQIPLITGKVGACISCNLCPSGRADIVFAIKKGRT